MNRSYSKIRHIQESNIRLEKRILSEQHHEPVKYVDPELKDPENNDPPVKPDPNYIKIISDKLKSKGFKQDDDLGGKQYFDKYINFIQWGYPDMSDKNLKVGVAFTRDKTDFTPKISVWTVDPDSQKKFIYDGNDNFGYDAINYALSKI